MQIKSEVTYKSFTRVKMFTFLTSIRIVQLQLYYHLHSNICYTQVKLSYGSLSGNLHNFDFYSLIMKVMTNIS